jgi:hypothetical protein
MKGLRYDAAAQIANEEFLSVVSQQSREQARDRYSKNKYIFSFILLLL